MHKILTAAKAAALILEQGIAAGLPDPYDVSANNYGPVKIQVDGPEAVAAWAHWVSGAMAVTTTRRVDHRLHTRFDGLMFDQLVRVVSVDDVPAEVSA